MRRMLFIAGVCLSAGVAISFSASGAADLPAPSELGRLAFVRDGNLWIAKGDGTGQKRIAFKGKAPVWSPDGKQIAFLRSGEAWVMNLARMKARQVSHTSGKAVTATWRSPTALFVVRESAYRIRYDWSPTGTPIGFCEGPESTRPTKRSEAFRIMLHDIIVVSLSGGPPLIWLGTIRTSFQQGQREFSGGQYVGNFDCPVVSPDQKQVAFIKDGDIWTVNNNPLECKAVVTFAHRIAAVADIWLPIPVGDEYSSGAQRLDWTPDGKHIVYDVQRHWGSGVHEIWVMDIEITDNILAAMDRRKITDLGDAGGGIIRHPCVSPDGRCVAFQSGGQSGWEIWVSDLDGKNMRRLLSNAEQPDWR